MRRKKKGKSTNDESVTEPHIGHITTPIEDKDLERVKTVLKSHGVIMHKIDSPDNWWLLLLPNGTTQTRRRDSDSPLSSEKVIIYTVRLPDGYCFLEQAAVFNADKSYVIFPRIFVDEEPGYTPS
jgi:hypothetical protein